MPKGIAFIDFQFQEHATLAMEHMDNYNFHGKNLKVTYAEMKHPPKPQDSHMPTPPPSNFPSYGTKRKEK